MFFVIDVLCSFHIVCSFTRVKLSAYVLQAQQTCNPVFRFIHNYASMFVIHVYFYSRESYKTFDSHAFLCSLKISHFLFDVCTESLLSYVHGCSTDAVVSHMHRNEYYFQLVNFSLLPACVGSAGCVIHKSNTDNVFGNTVFVKNPMTAYL